MRTKILTGNRLKVLGPWTPAEITTAAWYDAADSSTIEASGGLVSEWRDKSGNNRDISQGAGSNQPVYSSNSVQFNGTTHILQNISPFVWSSVECDIYVVFKGQNTTFSRLYGEGNTGDETPYASLLNTDSTTPEDLAASVRDNAGGNVASIDLSEGVFDDVKKLVSVSMTETSIASRVNAGSEVSGVLDRTGHTLTLNVFSLGGLQFGTNYRYIDADINEIVFTGNLSDPDRQKMEGYIAWKWGLEGSLPVGHPYKNSAPTE
jgi:hypothetical protein